MAVHNNYVQQEQPPELSLCYKANVDVAPIKFLLVFSNRQARG